MNDGAYGGTEYMVTNFYNKILPNLSNLQKYICVVLPGKMPDLNYINKDKKIILWLHNTLYQYDPFAINFIKTALNNNKIKKILVVSEFHKKSLIKDLGIPDEYFFIVNNAIDPINFNIDKNKSKNTINIIHASSFNRGTMELVAGIKFIEEDIRVDIYNDFNPDYVANLLDLSHSDKLLIFDLLKDERIFFHGKTPRRTVLDAFSNSSIYAYPCSFLFEETFCLSQVESMSAGCIPVYSNMGSLSEVSMGYGRSYNISDNLEINSKNFAKELDYAIKRVKDNSFDLLDQSKTINKRFGWENAKTQWTALDNQL